jgi:hypothetical protein
MSKVRKNPNVNDKQRDRYLSRRVLEQHGEAEGIWSGSGAKNMKQRCVDYLEDKTTEDHITYRLLKGVLFGFKYGGKSYPQTREEKYLDFIGMQQVRAIMSQIRSDPRFGYVSVGSGIEHENPVTHDTELVICDMTTEQRHSKKKSQTLQSWEDARNQVETTLTEGTQATVANALRSAAERQRLRREEFERRKRRNISGEEDEYK